jgi:hypothetical protein
MGSALLARRFNTSHRGESLAFWVLATRNETMYRWLHNGYMSMKMKKPTIF